MSITEEEITKFKAGELRNQPDVLVKFAKRYATCDISRRDDWRFQYMFETDSSKAQLCVIIQELVNTQDPTKAELVRQLAEVRAENKKFKEALYFYANSDYTTIDCGETAAAALGILKEDGDDE